MNKASTEKRHKNRRLLLENGEDIQEELGKDMCYEDMLASIIPMTYPSIFEDGQSGAELVAVKTSEGMRMGFFIEATGVLVATYPKVEQNKLIFMIAFIERSVVYTSGLELRLKFTGSLCADCERWFEIIQENEETISNILWLLSLKEEETPIH